MRKPSSKHRRAGQHAQTNTATVLENTAEANATGHPSSGKRPNTVPSRAEVLKTLRAPTFDVRVEGPGFSWTLVCRRPLLQSVILRKKIDPKLMARTKWPGGDNVWTPEALEVVDRWACEAIVQPVVMFDEAAAAAADAIWVGDLPFETRVEIFTKTMSASPASEGSLAPYVPTPRDVCIRMLELAAVKPEDVVYDLGCGDGRLVITAARRFGARAVGIDRDPARISSANANARAAGVADRVSFVQQDLHDPELDVSRATVVTLYLLSDSNLLLRPLLRRQLGPTARIVSHDFTMGDWDPVKSHNMVDDKGTQHGLYLWVNQDDWAYLDPPSSQSDVSAG